MSIHSFGLTSVAIPLLAHPTLRAQANSALRLAHDLSRTAAQSHLLREAV